VDAIYYDVFESWWTQNWESLCDEQERERRAIAAARATICELFPGEEPYWVMKAIWRNHPWHFLHKVFPKARYIHVVRCPTTALPSMMEFIGNVYPIWRDLKFTEREYIQAHSDALALGEAGLPYIMIRQEDIQLEPKAVWQKLREFIGLSDRFITTLECEIHASESMRGKVKGGRPPIAWTELSAEMFKLCRQLGYIPPQNVQPKDELACFTAEQDQLTEERKEFAQMNEQLMTERDKLVNQLDYCTVELSEIVNSRTWKAIKEIKKNLLLRAAGNLTLNTIQVLSKAIGRNYKA
jgi:hypothetical protein